MSETDTEKQGVAKPLMAPSYALPDRDEVPAFVPEIEAAIDAGRSIRPFGYLFRSALAGKLYAQGTFIRRLMKASSSTSCIGCGTSTRDLIRCAWRHEVPRRRFRMGWTDPIVPVGLFSHHACCRSCAAEYAKRARLRLWMTIFAGWLTLIAPVVWFVWFINSGSNRRAPSALAMFAPLALVAVPLVASAILRVGAGRRVPPRLLAAVPKGLTFAGWGLPSTRGSPRQTEHFMRSTGRDIVELRAGDLNVAAAISAVTDSAAGGVNVFLGTTRGEVRESDRVELVALDYEAYEAMAVAQLRALVDRARERWPIVRCVLLHRTGRVGLGEASVLIAVSCPHRVAAFEACRFLIDELKRDVAIWKKECWADGSVSWVHPETGVVTIDSPQAR